MSAPMTRLGFFLCLAAAVPLFGCGKASGEGSPEAATPGTRMPGIHVDQMVESLQGGVPAERKLYEEMVEACTNAGLTIDPLSPEELDLLGKTRQRAWYAATQQAYREESWHLEEEGGPGSCRFGLRLEGYQELLAGRRVEHVDYATGERTVGDLPPGALDRRPVDHADAVAEDATSAARPVSRTVAGQPCNEWTSSALRNRQCVWSGGEAWGFSAGPRNADHRLGPDAIVLAEEPLDGNGYRVTTTRFVVGEPIQPALDDAGPVGPRVGGER